MVGSRALNGEMTKGTTPRGSKNSPEHPYEVPDRFGENRKNSNFGWPGGIIGRLGYCHDFDVQVQSSLSWSLAMLAEVLCSNRARISSVSSSAFRSETLFLLLMSRHGAHLAAG